MGKASKAERDFWREVDAAPYTYPPGERHDRYDNPADVARWIPPATLERFPLGPYTVHGYYPATRADVTMAGNLPEQAASIAAELVALGCDVHVSADVYDETGNVPAEECETPASDYWHAAQDEEPAACPCGSTRPLAECLALCPL